MLERDQFVASSPLKIRQHGGVQLVIIRPSQVTLLCGASLFACQCHTVARNSRVSLVNLDMGIDMIPLAKSQ